MQWLRDHRMAALGFAASVAYWPFQLEGAFVPRWAVIAIGIPLVSKLDPRALPEKMWLLLGFLLFACVLSLAHSPFALVGVGDLAFVVILSLAFLMGAGLASLDDLMAGLGFGLAVSAALVILQYFGIWSPFPEGSRTAAGLFYNSEIMGEFSALVLVWLVASGVHTGNRLHLALGAVTSIPLALSFSRIGLGVALIGLMIAWRPKWPIVVLFVLGAVVAAGYYLVFRGDVSGSFHRMVLWGATLMSFTPLGQGLGWASLAFPEEQFSHSDAIQALVELGIAGLALLAIPVAAFRSKRGNHADYALFAAVLVEVFVSFPLHFPAGGFVAAVVAGFLVGRGPALCGLPPIRHPHDEPRRFRWGNVTFGDAGVGQFVGRLVSIRSVFTKPASLRPRSVGSLGGT